MASREKALTLLAGSGASGRAFLQVAADALALGLGTRWAGFGRPSADQGRIEVLAFTDRGTPGGSFDYPLDDSPCAKVYGAKRRARYFFCPDKVTERFSGPPLLRDIGAVSYRGEAILDDQDKPIAHVFAVNDRPVRDSAAARAFFRLVSQRVGAEYRRMLADEALLEREALLDLAHRTAGLGCWIWDPISDHVAWSPGTAEILGLSTAETWDITRTNYLDRFVHPADRERVRLACGGPWAEHASVALEYRILRAEGDVRTVYESCEAVFDADGRLVSAIGSIQDVTDAKRIEAALRRSEERFRDFTEAASDWVWELDADLDVSFMSERIQDVTGYPPSYYLGKALKIAMSAPNRDQWEKHLEEMRSQRSFRGYEYQARAVDGSETWVSISGKPLFDGTGRFIGYRGTGADITDRKNAEAALRQAKEEAESANAAKSRFLAAASHDLRQPLQALNLLLAALDNTEDEAEREIILSDLRNGVTSMGGLLNSLLDVSELEAGAIEPEVIEFKVGRLLELVAGNAAPRAREKGLDFKVVPCSVTIRSDPALLSRILQNFLSNAVQYTETGKVLLGCRRRGEMLCIQIWDNGLGIAEQQLPAIFEEFYQLDNPARDRSKGVGLGLAIVDRLARLLGHRIDVRSKIDAGSVFSVEVPMGRGCEVPSEVPRPPARGTEADFRGITVLLIEDDDIVALATRRLLEYWGAEVAPARSGRQALDAVAGPGRGPDVIIADYRLPGRVNGVEVVTRVRAQMGRGIPAVIMTGDTSPAQLREIRASGFAVIEKPADPGKIRNCLRDLLNQPAAAP